eukprot:Nk52_evm1s2592 gene=Nk52_evmTU1s2592
MKAAYDKFHKVEDVQLDTGTIVYLQKPKKDSKYANPFTGPYLVNRYDAQRNQAFLTHVFTDNELKRP